MSFASAQGLDATFKDLVTTGKTNTFGGTTNLTTLNVSGTTNAVTVNASGNVVVGGLIQASIYNTPNQGTALNFPTSGWTGSASQTGYEQFWNKNGLGETDLLSLGQAGVGGFYFYSINTTENNLAPTALFSADPNYGFVVSLPSAINNTLEVNNTLTVGANQTLNAFGQVNIGQSTGTVETYIWGSVTQTDGDYQITDGSLYISGGGGVYSDVSDSALYVSTTPTKPTLSKHIGFIMNESIQNTSISTGATYTLLSFTLPKGTWTISGIIQLDVPDSTTFNSCIISQSLDDVVQNTFSSGQLITNNSLNDICVNIPVMYTMYSTEQTYTLTIISSYSSSSVVNVLSNSYLQAVRVA
jgi:hypothetical protein